MIIVESRRVTHYLSKCASREGQLPSPTCLPGQGGSRKGMRPVGNETGARETVALLGQTGGGFFMTKRIIHAAPDGGPEFTSAGIRWSEVPEFARQDLAWMDGRHGSAQSPLPSVEEL